MQQLKINESAAEARRKRRRSKARPKRQITIIEGFKNLLRKKRATRNALLKKAYRKFTIHRQTYMNGMQKERYRNGIAYLSNPGEESIIFEAFDVISFKKIASCEYENHYLSEITVKKPYRRQGIATTFLKLANRHFALPRYLVATHPPSRYRLTSEGAKLVTKAVQQGIIRKKQLHHEPITSPCFTAQY